MNKTIMNDNKGFSLVELIVTVLVTSVLMLGVIAFVSSSRTAYQVVNTSATLQEEAITVERVFSEMIMEAKSYGFDEDVPLTSGKTVDVFWVTARDNENGSSDSVYFFVFDDEDNNIRYCKGTNPNDCVVKADEDSVQTPGITLINNQCYGTKKKFSLISEHVTSMSMVKPSVQRADGTDLVVLNLTYEYMGKTNTSTITAVTRNKNRAATTPTPDPSVTPDPDTP